MACSAASHVIRDPDNPYGRRYQRDAAAPGLSAYRRIVLLRDWRAEGRLCAYCPSLADSIDHVVPLVLGGTNFEDNLAPVCRPCNSSKGSLLLVEWRPRYAAAELRGVRLPVRSEAA